MSEKFRHKDIQQIMHIHCACGEECTELPYIGENGNWFVGGEDTGVQARGETGPTGPKGFQGEKGKKGERGETGPKGEKVIKEKWERQIYQALQDLPVKPMPLIVFNQL